MHRDGDVTVWFMGYLHLQRRMQHGSEEASLADVSLNVPSEARPERPRGDYEADGGRKARPPEPPQLDAEPLNRTSVSAASPDWQREACKPWSWQPARQVLRALRDYQRAKPASGTLALAAAKLAVLRHRFWSVVSGSDLPLNCSIDGGLVMPHPNGVVVHPDAHIGPNCILFQQVTIGTGPKPGLPRLGGHVDVGPGAKILGGVSVGDHAVIGANAVVLSDVPAGCVAVGIPATIKRELC
jgi:serine O-acetyltransferase